LAAAVEPDGQVFQSAETAARLGEIVDPGAGRRVGLGIRGCDRREPGTEEIGMSGHERSLVARV
jgi:hypothetical protein